MERGRAGLLAVVLVAVVSTGGGCSLLFMKPVQTDGVTKTAADCTSSRAAPVIDSIVWVAEGFRTGYALITPDSAYQGQTLSRGADIAIGTTLLALYAVSSGYGFGSAAECERLRDEEREEPSPRRRRARPRALPPPPLVAAPAYEATAYAAPPIDGGADASSASDGGTTPDGGTVRAAPPAAGIRPAPPAVPRRDPE